jgi:hypothetical protein
MPRIINSQVGSTKAFYQVMFFAQVRSVSRRWRQGRAATAAINASWTFTRSGEQRLCSTGWAHPASRTVGSAEARKNGSRIDRESVRMVGG